MFIIPDINKIAPGVMDKLNKLYAFLKEEKTSCENISQRFADKQMQRTIITLAQESNQYASEVYAQICSLSGKMDNSIEQERKVSTEASSNSDNDNINEVCDMSESKLLRFYKEILEDPFMLGNLRKMFQYQLDGLTGSILQLRLLQQSMYKN